MVETILVAVLSALGVVLIFWCVFGLLMLPTEGDGYAVLYAESGETCLRQIRAYLFLLHSGLLRLPLYIVDCGLDDPTRLQLQRESSEYSELRLFLPHQWKEFIETESKKRVSGT